MSALAPETTLPPLREDLELLPGPRQRGGAPTWTLHDPVTGRYFRIGRTEFAILCRWGLGQAAAIAQALQRETPLPVAKAQIDGVARFLAANRLIRPPDHPTGATSTTRRPTSRSRFPSPFFLRLPLFNPDALLAKLTPALAFLFAPIFWKTFMVLGLAGIFLASRQWDSFLATFPYFFTPGGIFLYGATLAGVKAVHELGHGLAAKHYGLRVPTMGVAFIFFWPVLFTDTTEAWRLPVKGQRLTIAAAGIAAEMAVAAVALLLWSFLPPGGARSAAFVLATATWLMTLAVNLNPLMRYDGYYLLSDWLEVPNLQARSLALWRWLAASVLTGLPLPCPEGQGRRTRAILLTYGAGALVYRFFLYGGLALLAWRFFFKALALVILTMMACQFFIIPLWRTGVFFIRLRGRAGHIWRPLATFALLLTILLLPLPRTITAPALYRPGTATAIYPPQGALLAAIHVDRGQSVTAGQLLFSLESPALDERELQARFEWEEAEKKLHNLAFAEDRVGGMQVMEQRLVEAGATLTAARRERERLTIIAAGDGMVGDRGEHLRPGQWVGPKERLALIIDPAGMAVEGFVTAADIDHIRPGSEAAFVPNLPEASPIGCAITAIDKSHLVEITDILLPSPHGGPLAARRDSQGRLVPEQTLYRVLLRPEIGVVPPAQPLTGVIRLSAPAASLFARCWRPLVAVLVRESGF